MLRRGLLVCAVLLAVVACTPDDDQADDDRAVATGDADPTPTEDAGPTPTEDARPTPTEDAEPTPTEDAGPTPADGRDPAPTEGDDPAPTTGRDPAPTGRDDPTRATEDPDPPPASEGAAPATEGHDPAPTERDEPPRTGGGRDSGEVDEELAAPFDRTDVVLTNGSRRVELTAYVADTAGLRRRGLQGWESLPERTGMLFVFDADSRGGFWMKDTLIPLSIAFADADGRIHTIRHMEPCEADPCPTYEADGAYRYALEVEQGAFDALGVETGWVLRHDV